MAQAVRTIDITPTWAQAALMMIALFENGTPEGKREACVELKRMAMYLDDFKAVDWGTVTSAAEIRGQQWRECADGESPDKVVGELWEADHDERNKMAGLIETAVKGAWKFLHKEMGK